MYSDYVNLRQGTDSCVNFSTGNTLPLTAVPFGMNHWTPQTSHAERWFFSPHARVFRGLRLTHQPSPWINDYAAIVFLPQTGEQLVDRNQRHSAMDPEKLILKPDYFEVEMLRYRTAMNMTPSCRGAIIECNFPANIAKRLILDFLAPKFAIKLADDRRSLSGWTSYNSGGVPDGFRFYFQMKFSVPVVEVGDAPDGVYCELPPECTALTIRLGTSFISPEQAGSNRQREIGDKTQAAIRADATRQWEELLSKIVIAGPEKQLQTFYSCFYRTFLFPRIFHEYDAAGKMVHYSPYDGGIHAGPMYADNGFWDTHRTVYPLFSLVIPERYAEMLEGWTNAAKEGGWFPRWSSPGYRACMIGTHADVIVADAVVKGITGFDIEAAYRAMLKNAFATGSAEELYGRRGIQEFQEQGYVPADRYEHAASRTMDYAYNDFAIAQVAKYLGDEQNYTKLMRRSQNYRNVFNPGSGWLQARNSDGGWPTDFSPLSWGGCYIEGSAWQCGWAVPHDVDGLIELYGGRKKFIARLDTMLAMPPDFEVGSYHSEIHEMTEMAVAGFGQYAQSNQPVHHVLWLYAHAGAAERAAQWIRKTAETLYTPERLPGDEDNGEMASWYVFATLGFYPLCPGKAEYVCSTPLAEKITLTTSAGKIDIVAALRSRPRYLTHAELLNQARH